MEKFTLKITYKHTEKEYNNITYSELYEIINYRLRLFDDLPDPKIKIEIFREYE